MSTPPAMRAAVLHSPGDLRIEDRPVPVPREDEVLVRVSAVGVCGSDVHYFEHGRIGDFVVRRPLVLGHEVAGEITAVGGGVPADRIGERVAVEPGFPCRRCDQCHAGRYNLCPDIAFFGTPPIDGALTEYVTVPSDFAHPVPDTLSDDATALLEPLSVGVWANRKAGTTAGARVLIAGAGPIGLVTAQVARAMGATDVVVTDVSAERLKIAESLGTTGVLAAGPGTQAGAGGPATSEFDAFIDCSGAPAAIEAGVRAVRPAGRVVLVGMGPETIGIPFGVLQQRELTVTGTFRYAGTWPTAISLAASGDVNLDALVTGHYELGDTTTALRAGTDPRRIKAIVNP